MSNENLVKVTVEFDGESDAIDAECALVVAFSDKGDGYDCEVLLKGYSSIAKLADVLANSIWDMDKNHDGFAVDVSRNLSLLAIESALEKIKDAEDCDE